jgi:iron uptake system component EfeO
MRSSRRLSLTALSLLSLLAAPALAACGGADAATSVAVEASDDDCKVASSHLDPGQVTFKVTNKGSKVTEVYVYGEQDGTFTKVVGEVENIGPGTSRDLKVKLGGGTYELACKPGQKGDGIRQKVLVSGEKSSSSGKSSYDREIELAVDGSGVTGLDGAKAKKGEKIEFKLANKADRPRILEVIDPAGKAVADVTVAKGATGEVVVELSKAGAWTVKIEGGPEEIEKPLPVS